jgi:hypothetical protein
MEDSMPEPIEIVVYDWEGRRFGLRLERLCVECALALAQANAVAAAHPEWPVRVTRKHWLDHFWEALRHGGFHPPVILVDGHRIRQGSVPTRAELTAAVERALQRRGLANRQATAASTGPSKGLQHTSQSLEDRVKLGFFRSTAPVIALVVSLSAAGPADAQQRRQMVEERIGDGIMVTVLPKDAIPALSNPVFISRAQADRVYSDDEPILGVVDEKTGEARAYSLWHLDRHEIVNDVIGGKPIAVTW